LHPLPRNAKTLSISGCHLEEMQSVILAVQDSKLAHTSLQARMAQDAEPAVDILFEGTEAGIAAQEAQLREIARPSATTEATSARWNASQELWNSANALPSAMAKITTLPASIAGTAETVQRITAAHRTHWRLTMQATGIGWLRLEGSSENLHAALSDLRFDLEHAGGSLVVAHHPADMQHIEAWGQPGDALALMRAVKNQFDAKNTLNPGRFVGGI
jgi:glycolate oxidase FAD binding subunit